MRFDGHIIEARAVEVRGGGWTPYFCIEKHLGDSVLVTRFTSGQMFETQENALKAGFYLGALKIRSGFAPTARRPHNFNGRPYG
ncbi:MAG: hypothetical protein WAL51_08795 [Candidatus Acidiferrales bacterium]